MTHQQDPIVIASARRTPMGGFQGSLSSLPAPALGATAIRAAIDDAGLRADAIDEVLLGNVLPAGIGQAPTRQAALQAGLPESVLCAGVSKVCGSGMKAVMHAHDMLLAGSQDIIVAGGMESMSNAPYLLDKARSGYRLGHGRMLDHMFLDGLEDAYGDKGALMGVFAERTAGRFGFSREAQDEYATESLRRARQAVESGAFSAEVASVTVPGRKGDTVVEHDEQPLTADPGKIPSLRPAFAKEGTVTAANSSSISDGAAALVLMRASTAEARGIKPLAKILGATGFADEPGWFTTAPVYAMQKLADRLDRPVDGFDLYEINEAFAVVTMAAMVQLKLAHDRVNVHGGACALGHPIGASGARILVTLLHALKASGGQTGMASLCIGGGEATAVAVEML